MNDFTGTTNEGGDEKYIEVGRISITTNEGSDMHKPPILEPPATEASESSRRYAPPVITHVRIDPRLLAALPLFARPSSGTVDKMVCPTRPIDPEQEGAGDIIELPVEESETAIAMGEGGKEGGKEGVAPLTPVSQEQKRGDLLEEGGEPEGDGATKEQECQASQITMFDTGKTFGGKYCAKKVNDTLKLLTDGRMMRETGLRQYRRVARH